jgi:hypothetical protein
MGAALFCVSRSGPLPYRGVNMISVNGSEAERGDQIVCSIDTNDSLIPIAVLSRNKKARVETTFKAWLEHNAKADERYLVITPDTGVGSVHRKEISEASIG